MVKQYFRYTAGRMETPADHALIARVLDDFRDSHFRFKELIISQCCPKQDRVVMSVIDTEGFRS
jgi:hypothetical protein